MFPTDKLANPLGFAGYFDPTKPSQVVPAKRPNLLPDKDTKFVTDNKIPSPDTFRLTPYKAPVNEIQANRGLVTRGIDSVIGKDNTDQFVSGASRLLTPALQAIDPIDSINNQLKGTVFEKVQPLEPSKELKFQRQVDKQFGVASGVERELLSPPSNRLERAALNNDGGGFFAVGPEQIDFKKKVPNNIDNKPATENITGLESLREFNTSFGANIERLSKAIESIPANITMNVSHKLEVIHNGAQWFANLEPSLQKLAEETVKEGINKMLKAKFPNVGTV